MSNILVTGRLDDDAQARSTADGQHLLLLRLTLPAPAGLKPVHLRAVRHYGSGAAAAFAAQARARQLRRGATVTVHAASLTQHRGYVQLAGVDHLETPHQASGRDRATP